MCEKSAKKLCRFGRIKPVGPPALRLAIPAGLVIATVIGIALQSAPVFPHNTMNEWLRALLIGVCVAPASIALVWAVVVDRSTVPGAIPNPEHSVEFTWYDQWLRALLIGVCVAPASIALVWAVVVDRSTVPGAIPNPEHSVEFTWYDQAAKDSFHLLRAGTGLGAALTSFWLPPMVSWTLIAVFAFAALVFAVSYLVRRES